jgi:hypothetical protein
LKNFQPRQAKKLARGSPYLLFFSKFDLSQSPGHAFVMISTERAENKKMHRSGNTPRNMTMTTETQAEQQKPANENLALNYRPLGLKAVLAAALMLKRKPAPKIA